MPESYYLFIAVPATAWLVCVIACLIALRWSIAVVPGRFWAGMIISVSAMVIGLAGLTRFNFIYSKTVNGKGWTIHSKWFFIFLMVLSAISLLLTLWRRTRQNRVPPKAT